MKLFIEEQLKYLTQDPEKVQYHPMIIKFCLGLHTKSAAAYEQLRLDKNGIGVLVLPYQRTLCDYRNYIHPKRGFNYQIVNELRGKKEFSELERYIVLLFDEMKIQDDLVWNKNTGELIGFIDWGDIDLNYATLQKSDNLASHVLVFWYVKSIVVCICYFCNRGYKILQTIPIILNLKVIAAV